VHLPVHPVCRINRVARLPSALQRWWSSDQQSAVQRQSTMLCPVVGACFDIRAARRQECHCIIPPWQVHIMHTCAHERYISGAVAVHHNRSSCAEAYGRRVRLPPGGRAVVRKLLPVLPPQALVTPDAASQLHVSATCVHLAVPGEWRAGQ